jgi:DNA topoisomerase-1
MISGYVKSTFGDNYLKARNFKTKDASAQEAHEAIRPTDITRTIAGKNDYEKKLYKLIWARTVATQMANAKVAKTTIKLGVSEPLHLGHAQGRSPKLTVLDKVVSDATFIAKGEVVIFDGFLKVYGKSKDLELPKVAKDDKIDCLELTTKQTYAKPPARYTEGSLVKKLEELGIGRPSTYATIMTAIQTRGYVVKGESEGEERDVVELRAKNGKVERKIIQEKYGANKGKLIPTPIGELVAGFLTDNFKNIVDYKFTANIEKDLDLVADAKLERVKMLRDFYKPFRDTVLAAQGVERYNNARLLGHDPKTGKPIYAKVGKNGGFIQLGDNEKTADEKPRFAPLPKRKSVNTVTLEQALKQLDLPALPRVLGKAPDGAELVAANGPFGPYLKGGKYNIPMKDLDPYTVSLDEALPLYQAKIDSIIADWGEIMIINGAYGPYVKGPGRRNNVKIPKEQDPKKITHKQAEEMLANKPKTTRRGARGRRKTTKKSKK